MDLMTILTKLPHPLDDVLIYIGFAIAIYFLWRFNQTKANKSAIENYEAITRSQDLRIKQLENDIKTLTSDRKNLEAQVNQLIGENKALKDLLTYQDPTFRAEFKELVNVVNCMKRNDDERYDELTTASETNAKKIKTSKRHIDALETIKK